MAAGGVEWEDWIEAVKQWAELGSGLDSQKVVWGGQDGPRPEAPSVILRISNISESGPTWKDTVENFLEFDDIVVTADAGANTLSAAAHTLVTGDGPVRIASTLTVPGGLAPATDYWIIRLDDNTVQLADTFARSLTGTFLDISSAGSGTITIADTPTTRRVGEEILEVTRVMLDITVELRCHAATVPGENMAVAILQRIRMRRERREMQEILNDANSSVGRVGSILGIFSGTRDDFLHEPRALLMVHFNYPAEESEALHIIERALVTNRIRTPEVEFAVPE